VTVALTVIDPSAREYRRDFLAAIKRPARFSSRRAFSASIFACFFFSSSSFFFFSASSAAFSAASRAFSRSASSLAFCSFFLLLLLGVFRALLPCVGLFLLRFRFGLRLFVLLRADDATLRVDGERGEQRGERDGETDETSAHDVCPDAR
jgi:hypothetical protein